MITQYMQILKNLTRSPRPHKHTSITFKGLIRAVQIDSQRMSSFAYNMLYSVKIKINTVHLFSKQMLPHIHYSSSRLLPEYSNKNTRSRVSSIGMGCSGAVNQTLICLG